MNVSIPAAHLHPADRSKSVSILLGPTNTGKTHYAIERMLAHESGIIGLPLRLLAREVYNRVIEKVGAQAVALVTGEEKIKPKNPSYWISTVEAMPRDLDVAFVAVDEIQLAADLDRGHIFTDRLLNRRGSEETLLIGASTMERALRELLPGAPIFSRPRLSKLTFAGEKKIARLPRRSAIVAFSAEEVYAIAEWIRRQRGGAAVVLGALSPRTRNAQVEMFQNGDIDYIVATDAIGMGLNLDVDHIAFASDRKFDGWHYRRLIPAEFGQIAGRAGRHMRDGTFGTTGRCPPFDAELVEALEDHRFDPIRMLQWRNTNLDFSSLAMLAASLDTTPKEPGLTRAPVAEDQLVLEIASRDEKVIRAAKTKADIARLWETCQIPDYRKLSPAAHAELVLSIFHFIVRAGHIPEDWFSRHVGALDRVDGDLDTLSARIAQVRTWTFIANRTDWLDDPEHWQGVTRRVEDILSDALHERLAQRFVDRRTSVLMRRLRENAMLEAEVTSSGDVMVEGQHVGHLNGFRFTLDPQAGGEEARTLNAAAQKALASEIEGRATRVHEAVDEAFVLANDGLIRWLGEPVGKLIDGAHILEPRVRILSDEQLTGADLEKVQRRLDLWAAQHIKKLLGPLAELEKGEGLEGIARGIAFQVAEALGILERSRVAEDVKGLSQEARAALRKFGVRFGAFHLYLPQLVKPAPRALSAQLWALRHGGVEEMKGLDEVPHLASSGRTSFVANKDVPKGLYRAAGFRVCGDRAVRVDILERLADLIRPAVAYRPGTTPGDAPPGSADGDGFVVTVNMTSLAGCSGESFASILRSLGYQSEQRKGPAITVPLIPKASTEPVHPPEAAPASNEDAPDQALSESNTVDVSAEAPAETKAETSVETPIVETPIEAATETLAETVSEPIAALSEETQAAGTEPSSEGAETVAETEPQLIEVWRPHRQKHAAPRNQRNRPMRHAHAVRASASAVPAEATEANAATVPRREDGDSPRRADRRRPPRRDNQKQNQETGAVPSAGAVQEQSARPRFDNRRGKPNHKGSRQEEHQQGRENKPANAPRPVRERQPDPNSPFAKLLELKARLENNADSK
jgi:ATP-dependent RNA helicase SUPV3L1/SUV3